MIDIKHTLCSVCDTRASYGFIGQLESKCARHKEDLMFKQPRKRCIGNEMEECKEIATHGINEQVHCEEHSLENEICFISAKCIGCGRNDELLTKEKLCINFCRQNELYQLHKTQQKVKEKLVLKYLDENVESKNIISITDDKIVNKFCNYYRPDRIYDCITHYVIIEIDEFQHKKYKNNCPTNQDIELIRMHEIYNASGLPCIFLRFNPDNFVVKRKQQQVNMDKRLKILLNWIYKCIEMIPESEFETVKYKYLFYDEYNETDVNFLEIDDTKLV